MDTTWSGAGPGTGYRPGRGLPGRGPEGELHPGGNGKPHPGGPITLKSLINEQEGFVVFLVLSEYLFIRDFRVS